MKLYWRILRFIDKIKYKRHLPVRTIYESNWADVFHETINDKPYLKTLALAPRSYACNYSLLYIISRIIFLYKPKSILEFGLGESSKFISTIAAHNNFIERHTIIEHSKEWIEVFNQKFSLPNQSQIQYIPNETKYYKEFGFMGYEDIVKHVNKKYTLYIVDGPLGSRPFSRRDILELAKHFTNSDDFIIVIDDAERLGEKNTIGDLLKILDSKNIKYYKERFDGLKSQYIIATEIYKYACTI